MNKKTIEQLKNTLEKRVSKLEKELNLIANPTEQAGDFKAKYEDIGEHKDENATEVEGYVGNIALENTLEEQLANAKNALEKITAGTFGTCEECGGSIREERLKIHPSAKRCMKCAS